jgi:hypothetical protein
MTGLSAETTLRSYLPALANMFGVCMLSDLLLLTDEVPKDLAEHKFALACFIYTWHDTTLYVI